MSVTMRYGSGRDSYGKSGSYGDSSLLHLAWENPSPGNSFAAQTIDVDLTDYDWFAVRAKFSLATPQDLPLFIFSVDETGKYLFSVAGDTNRVGSRSITYNLANMTLAISDGYYNGSANNNSVIPLEIYGVKL